MYCIVNFKFEKKYLAFQFTDDSIEYGYYLTDKETFILNLSQNDRNHPTVFKTEDKAIKFIKWLCSVRTNFSKSDFSYEWIENAILPKCDMHCWKCNKKKKYTCKHLKNPYQNYCGAIMARFNDSFNPNTQRLDAPCEQCLTKGCKYNMNFD